MRRLPSKCGRLDRWRILVKGGKSRFDEAYQPRAVEKKVQRAMRSLAYVITALIVMSLLVVSVPSVIASPNEVPVANIGDTIKIITPGTKTRLCPKPLCKQDQEIMRIPANTEFKVEEVARERLPMWDVVWYKITYKGKKGWVSEFDTDTAPKEPRKRH
jgi:hypothetical protein